MPKVSAGLLAGLPAAVDATGRPPGHFALLLTDGPTHGRPRGRDADDGSDRGCHGHDGGAGRGRRADDDGRLGGGELDAEREDGGGEEEAEAIHEVVG